MASSLDMNLDDIVRQNRSRGKGRSGSRGKGGGRSRGDGRGGREGGGEGLPLHIGDGDGPNRRFGGRGILGPSPYLLPSVPATRNFFGKASMELVEPMLVPADGRGKGTRLYVSNLDYGVTSQDIKVLFSEVGKLKRYSIHCDESGRPKGTAEVVYERYGDALAAIMRYDNVDLDGRPLRIELIGVKVLPPTPLRAPAATGNTRRPNLPFNFKSGGGESFRGRRPAHGGDSFGKDKGPGGAQCQVQVQGEEIVWGKKLTAEELDA
ncbi:unnamed protein product [Linum tenue]|uniref:RRM domain-containing protein n=1 Tax=Linum tenue TaxID=586396 RepID=A0AAV0MB44_9ROSI|nr:unnamed protein product [Linum tenue]